MNIPSSRILVGPIIGLRSVSDIFYSKECWHRIIVDAHSRLLRLCGEKCVLSVERYLIMCVSFPDDRCCMFRACMLDSVGSTFSGNKQQGYFSAIMKRYMSSKILYAPDNRHTRRIIKKVSDVIFIPIYKLFVTVYFSSPRNVI